jgi:hypothetical protein
MREARERGSGVERKVEVEVRGRERSRSVGRERSRSVGRERSRSVGREGK